MNCLLLVNGLVNDHDPFNSYESHVEKHEADIKSQIPDYQVLMNFEILGQPLHLVQSFDLFFLKYHVTVPSLILF
jgi:hypothetical protein